MPKSKRRRRQLWSRFFGRDGDQRSVLGKELQEYLVDAEHSPTMMNKIVELRGDLSGKWRDRFVPCLYCGLQASEEDHYKSAVKKGLISPYLDCPMNRVPSCSKCHRGGKDHPAHANKTIMEWFNMAGRVSKNHPKNVMRNAKCSQEHILNVKRRLERFDLFHRTFAPRMSPKHLEHAQNFVERVLLFRNVVFKSVSRYENQQIFKRRNYVQESNKLFDLCENVINSKLPEPQTYHPLEPCQDLDNSPKTPMPDCHTLPM